MIAAAEDHRCEIGGRPEFLLSEQVPRRNSQELGERRELTVVRRSPAGFPIADHGAAHPERVGHVLLPVAAPSPSHSQPLSQTHGRPPSRRSCTSIVLPTTAYYSETRNNRATPAP